MYKAIIVDDEFWIREGLKQLIDWNSMGIEIVAEAKDGKKALELIKEFEPQILLTDVKMPFLNGIELIEEIVKNKYDVHTVMLSGYDDFKYVRNAMIYGADDYLLKPVKKDELLSVIKNIVSIIAQEKNAKKEQVETNSIIETASAIIKDSKLTQRLYVPNFNMESSEISAQYPSYIMAILKIRGYKNVLGQMFKGDVVLLDFFFKNIVDETLRDKEHLFFHNQNEDTEYVMIINQKFIEENSGVFVRLLAHIQSILKINADIFISNESKSFEDLKMIYGTIKAAVNCRPFKPSCNIVKVSNCSKEIDFKVYEDKLRLILYHLEACNPSHAVTSFKEMVSGDIKTYGQIKSLVERLFYSLSDRLSILDINFYKLYEIDIEDIKEIVEELSIEKLETSCNQLFNNICITISQKLNYKNIKVLVINIKQYISTNYFEDISLSMLADKFHIEGAYLSKSFKQETGENLTNYIANVRINKAMELIKEGKIKISEISEIVGYDDYSYFSRVFKKILGKGPRDYHSGL